MFCFDGILFPIIICNPRKSSSFRSTLEIVLSIDDIPDQKAIAIHAGRKNSFLLAFRGFLHDFSLQADVDPHNHPNLDRCSNIHRITNIVRTPLRLNLNHCIFVIDFSFMRLSKNFDVSFDIFSFRKAADISPLIRYFDIVDTCKAFFMRLRKRQNVLNNKRNLFLKECFANLLLLISNLFFGL